MEECTLHNPKFHFEPKIAIIGYEAINGYYGRDECYFSRHTVRNGKLGVGSPLTMDMVRDMLKLVDVDQSEFSFKGRLPKQLLYFRDKGTLQLVWSCDRTTERLLFKEQLDIPTGTYPIPKLVFSLSGESLSVFAITRKKPIHDGTELYHAPFMNVYASGKVCMGDAMLQYRHLDFYEDIMAFTEKQFFLSVFTHTNHDHLLNGNYTELMLQMQGIQNFEESLLLPNHQLLQHVYEN